MFRFLFRHVPAYSLAFLGTFTAGCYDRSPPTQPEVVTSQLIGLLRDPDPEVRRTAALSLGKIGRIEATRALVGELTDTDSQVREASAWALGNLGEEVTDLAGPALANLLWDSVADARATAARALGQMRPSGALVAIILKAVHDSNPGTRLAGVQALGWLESPVSFKTLIQALKDPDSRVRQAAVAALGELGDVRAAPFLIERLSSDREAGVRSEAVFRLGTLDGPAALQALQAAIRDTDPRVRIWARAAVEFLLESQRVGDDRPGERTISVRPTSQS